MSEVYHTGELSIQEQFGEQVIANHVGKVINNSIIKGAIRFIEKQNTVILSSADSDENIWVSILIGDFGFTEVPNENSISFNKKKIMSPETDIFYKNIENNPNIGSLFIELGSRRRYRINGKVSTDDTHINIAIDEAYPNCPKYIQRRLPSLFNETKNSNANTTKGTLLNGLQKYWIVNADTFFVGTQGEDQRLDASHRGGNPGFIEILENNTLKIPDYQGNKMYNTLGNIFLNPRAGLLFIDFENKRTLQLSGKATLLFHQNSDGDNIKTTGTGRYWLFTPEQWIQTDNHHQIDWEFLDYSPLNP